MDPHVRFMRRAVVFQYVFLLFVPTMAGITAINLLSRGLWWPASVVAIYAWFAEGFIALASWSTYQNYREAAARRVLRALEDLEP